MAVHHWAEPVSERVQASKANRTADGGSALRFSLSGGALHTKGAGAGGDPCRGKVPPDQRRTLFLRLQGRGFRDIGKALGKSENWARVTFFRAKATIVKEMEES